MSVLTAGDVSVRVDPTDAEAALKPIRLLDRPARYRCGASSSSG
jgi:hypothetical protein